MRAACLEGLGHLGEIARWEGHFAHFAFCCGPLPFPWQFFGSEDCELLRGPRGNRPVPNLPDREEGKLFSGCRMSAVVFSPRLELLVPKNLQGVYRAWTSGLGSQLAAGNQVQHHQQGTKLAGQPEALPNLRRKTGDSVVDQVGCHQKSPEVVPDRLLLEVQLRAVQALGEFGKVGKLLCCHTRSHRNHDEFAVMFCATAEA